MRVLTLPGNPPVDIEVRRSTRARRYSLRISNVSSEVSLTLPANAPLDEALRFAKSRESWIRDKLTSYPPRTQVRFGDIFPFLGRDMTLRRASGSESGIDGSDILIAASDATLGAKLRALCKVHAREQVSRCVDIHAAQLGKRVSRLTFRDTKSRWGSCSQQGNLMFSWRLIMAPPDVLDYVVAHEVAHLVEMNHSAQFWSVVERLKPDFREHRRWLKENGRNLLRYQV